MVYYQVRLTHAGTTDTAQRAERLSSLASGHALPLKS